MGSRKLRVNLPFLTLGWSLGHSEMPLNLNLMKAG